MHFTALVTLVTALIPAVTPVPAPSPQPAENDVHLELNSKDVAEFFNERKAKTTYDHYDAEAPTEPSLLSQRAYQTRTNSFSRSATGDSILLICQRRPGRARIHPSSSLRPEN